MAEAAKRLSVAIVQMKPAKGQYAANLETAGQAFAQLASDPPGLVALPEGALTGYFLEGAVYDLAVSAQSFASDLATAWRVACPGRSVDIAAGFFENDEGTYYNSALYVHVEPREERILHVHRKMFLPTYGVFDEERFLSRGRHLAVFETAFGRIALLVCEDACHAIMPTFAAVKGARVLIVPSASPGRGIEGEGELASVVAWRDILRAAATEHGIYVIYAGLTGFEGGKGMSGASCVIDPRGRVLVTAPTAEPVILRAVLDSREIDLARATRPLLGDLNAVLPDLVLDPELPIPRAAPLVEEVRDASGR